MSIITDALLRLQSKRAGREPRAIPTQGFHSSQARQQDGRALTGRKFPWAALCVLMVLGLLSFLVVGGGAFWLGDSAIVGKNPQQNGPLSLSDKAISLDERPSDTLSMLSRGAMSTQSELPLASEAMSRDRERPTQRNEPAAPSLNSLSLGSSSGERDSMLTRSFLSDNGAVEKITRHTDASGVLSARTESSLSTLSREWEVREAYHGERLKAVTGQNKDVQVRQAYTSSADRMRGTNVVERSRGEKPPVQGQLQILQSGHRSLAQGKSLVEKRLYSEAAEALIPLFRSPSERWEPWFWMGSAQLGLGNLDEAERHFEEGLARDGAVAQLWVQYALVAQQRGKYGMALDALRQGELLAPDLPAVQLNLGHSLETLGQARPAAEHYHTFLSLTEGDPPYHAIRKKVVMRLVSLREDNAARDSERVSTSSRLAGWSNGDKTPEPIDQIENRFAL